MTKLDDLLLDAIQRDGIPGVAIAVVRGDETVATAAAGAADLVSGSPMRVGGAGNWFSMTKIVTATMAAMLADRGELDVDTPVREFLPDIWPMPFAAVRLRHLLNHSSGLSSDRQARRGVARQAQRAGHAAAQFRAAPGDRCATRLHAATSRWSRNVPGTSNASRSSSKTP